MRNLESGNNAPPNEPIRIYVLYIGNRLGLHPLCEVINTDVEPSSITRSFLEMPHYVQALMGKWPRTSEWIQNPSQLMDIWSVSLTLIALLNILLGNFLYTWPPIPLYEIKNFSQYDFHKSPNATERIVDTVPSGSIYTTFAPRKANIVGPSYISSQPHFYLQAITLPLRMKLKGPSNLARPVYYASNKKLVIMARSYQILYNNDPR